MSGVGESGLWYVRGRGSHVCGMSGAEESWVEDVRGGLTSQE